MAANPNTAPYVLTNLAGFAGASAGMRESGGNIYIQLGGALLKASAFSMTYGLNSIPSATALIPLGRDVRTGSKAPIHSAVKSITFMSECTVILTGNLLDWSTEPDGKGGKKQWPKGSHILFVGYVAGITYRRSVGRVVLSLNLIQKLVDLSRSSVGSGDVVPGAINDLLLSETMRGAGGEVFSNAGGKFIGQLPDDISIDFSKGLLKVIEYVCQNNQLQTHSNWCGSAQGPAAGGGSNVAALKVLRADRLWNGMHNLIGTDKYCANYPLKIHAKGKAHLSDWVGRRIASSLAGDSIWSLLVGSLLPSFGLYVIPTAREAYVAPVLPMTNRIGKTIKVNEFVDFNLSSMSQQPLYGVGVMSSYNLATINGGSPQLCVGASYTPSPDGTGMWMFTNAPGWMDGWVNYDPDTVQGEPDVVKMLNRPTKDSVGNQGATIERDASGEVDQWNLIMSRYAQMVYASNSLRGRQGTLTGKLRWDISPGTMLRVEGKGLGPTTGDDLATAMIGLVASVTVTINSEQASATTSFNLTNLRTDEENTSPYFTMSQHPFFPDYFTYAPLVKTLKVD